MSECASFFEGNERKRGIEYKQGKKGELKDNGTMGQGRMAGTKKGERREKWETQTLKEGRKERKGNRKEKRRGEGER